MEDRKIIFQTDKDVAIEVLEMMVVKLDKYTHGEMVMEKVKSIKRVIEYLQPQERKYQPVRPDGQ